MFNFFNNLISATDFISEKPQILLNGSVRAKTIYGGTLSIISIILILIAITTFSLALINRKNSTLTYNKIPTTNTTYDYGKYPFMIALLDNGLKLIEEEDRYYSFLADIWAFTPDNSTGTVVMKLNRTTIHTEKCDINKHFGEYVDYFKDVPYLNHHYCMVPGQNISLYGIYGSIQPYNFLDFWISTCTNNTSLNRTNCYSRSKSQQRLVNTYISYQFLENFIDHTNIDSPGGLMLHSEILPVSSTIYKRDFFYHRNINYFTDLDFIFSTNNLQTYNQLVQFRETADLRPEGTVPGSFALLSIMMDNSYDEYHRRFTKFQEVLANLGGLFKGICTIAYILNYILFDELYYMNIMSGIFRNDYIKAPGMEVNKENINSLKMKSGLNYHNASNNISGTLVNIVQSNNLQLGKIMNLNSNKNPAQVVKREKSKVENYDALKLGFWELIYIRCAPNSLVKKKKIRAYKLAKEYTEQHLCIKNILNSITDVNKLKCFIFNQDQLSLYNEIPTPSIFSIDETTSNIWEDIVLKKDNTKGLDPLIAGMRLKLHKSEIDNNFIKIIDMLDCHDVKLSSNMD